MNRISTAIAATLLLVLAAAPVAAQTFHVSGGLNRAELIFSGVEDAPESPKAAMRMVAGVGLAFPLAGRIGLQLGADYSLKGFQGVGEDGAGSFHVDYLEGSALLDIALGGGEGASLSLLVGPTVAYEMSCQLVLATRNEDCGSETKDLDAGVAGGLRAAVGVSDSMDLTIGAFYNFGILNINDGAGTVRSRTMTARAGFAYRIG